MSLEVVGLILGNGEAMGGLETFGRSVVVIIGIDIIAIVVVVMIGKAGERSFTRGRWLVDVHYGSNCLIKAVPKCYRGVMLQHACA